jgi:3-oxoacyl-[acyl-carrier-protein] synthase II
LPINMRHPSVVITGVGLATPLGSDFATFAASLLAGRSAARAVIDEQAGVEVRLPACLSEDPPVPASMNAAEFRALPRSEQFLLWCATSALLDAGYASDRSGVRVGLIVGSGGELLRRWEGDWMVGGREVYQGGTDSQTLAASAWRQLQLNGPCQTIAAACASANYAIALARRWIELGLADVCLAGAVETITPVCRSAFNNLRALSRRADEPTKASRPFDAERDGFVIGEGAGMLVLESAERAARRGAKMYAEVAGFGASSDAFHMIIPSSDPAPAAAAMQAALQDADIQPREVDYVNAHATSTPVGDKGEARALKAVLGASSARVPVSSTKSMTGHLLSAAAAVEALACLAAIEHQRVPPTINLDTPDPECDLCHVPHHSIAARVEIAISNSFGFGGSNTTLVLRKAA